MTTRSLVTIKGPMFSGKSLMLMYLAKRRRIAKRKGEHIIVFKWAADRRHIESQARAELLSSHDGQTSMEAIPVSTTREMQEYIETQVRNLETDPLSVYVDEAQFFEHENPGTLMPWVMELRRRCKGLHELVLAGLDLYYDNRNWAWWPLIEPHANKRLNLMAVCHECHCEEGIYSRRVQGGDADVQVGGAEAYIVLCWACDLARS
jgi:thymidine kinase